MNKFQDFGFEESPLSYWIASTNQTQFPSLSQDINIDVAVVGGGITGITSAWLLKKEGLRVALIESDKILRGTTGHTTAKITSQHELIYDQLIKLLGRERAQQYADANQNAIEFIASLVEDKNIDCDFSRQSAYVFTQQNQMIDQIGREVEAASSLGIKASYLTQLPIPLKVKAAEKFDNQAQFHPRKYLLALADEIPDNGSYIFENSRVIDLHEGNPVTLITENGSKITAENIIIATHFPFYGGNGFYFTRMYAEMSYALGIKIKEKFSGGMYISAEDPGKSLRSTPIKDDGLVIVAGEHHKTGHSDTNTNVHFKKLIEFAKETYEVESIPYRWSTQDYVTLDDVPYIGRISKGTPNIYIATGFKKWGITHGTASGIILKDLIVKGENPWADVFDPSRFEADPMIKSFVTTNLDVAKHLIGDKFKSAPDNIDIEPGEGKVVEIDGEKMGAYKDDTGKLHLVDITCTHMGCTLNWNAAELTWDCPCHASRFTYDGTIIDGPALKPLTTDDNFKFNP